MSLSLIKSGGTMASARELFYRSDSEDTSAKVNQGFEYGDSSSDQGTINAHDDKSCKCFNVFNLLCLLLVLNSVIIVIL